MLLNRPGFSPLLELFDAMAANPASMPVKKVRELIETRKAGQLTKDEFVELASFWLKLLFWERSKGVFVVEQEGLGTRVVSYSHGVVAPRG